MPNTPPQISIDLNSIKWPATLIIVAAIAGYAYVNANQNPVTPPVVVPDDTPTTNPLKDLVPEAHQTRLALLQKTMAESVLSPSGKKLLTTTPQLQTAYFNSVSHWAKLTEVTALTDFAKEMDKRIQNEIGTDNAKLDDPVRPGSNVTIRDAWAGVLLQAHKELTQ